MKYTIAIADDHLLIAKALGSIIEHFENYEVLYEVANGKALQDKLAVTNNIPDIVLLDVSMPIMDGFETAVWLKKEHPAVLIMALSMQDDDQSIIKMIKGGARGYLHKNVHPIEFEKALNALVTKGYYYPEWATSKIMQNLGETDMNKNADNIALSNRECDFLKHVCSEMTYKDIGEKMFVSGRTVESYRDSLFEKLGLKTRTGLVLYAIRSGLVNV